MMDSLHESQEKVDCLDFLVRRMEKEREVVRYGKYRKNGIGK